MHESIVLADERGRIVFVMPHDRYVLVGTTDTDFAGDPASVRTEIADVEYLLAVLAESLPRIKLTKDDVATSFAGLRALVISEDKESPSSVPREEVIMESASGLITVAGGKFTTHRAIAQKVVDRVMRRWDARREFVRRSTTPLPGARALADGDSSGGGAVDAKYSGACGGDSQGSLRNARADCRADRGRRPELAEPLSRNCPAIGAEVVNAVSNEMAHSVGDFLMRRTSLSWRSPVEAEAARAGGRANHGGGARMGSRARGGRSRELHA